MADELTLNASLEYEDSEDSEASLAIEDLLVTISTKKFIHAKQNIGITEEAIGLGEVTALGWGLFVNRDATNYIELRVGTGGTKFAKLRPGKFAFFEFGSGVTAPYAIADTAACQMEYIIVSQ